jgi:hypothetical protein
MVDLTTELLKTTVQLLLLGVVGGAVSFFYSKRQKNRELKISTLERIADLHGRFLALRYEYNSFFIQWRGRESTTKKRLSTEDIEKQKWACYTRACQLVGEFQSLNPLVAVLFPGHEQQLGELYSIYQEWRRQSGEDSPIFQDANGKSAEQFKSLREKYGALIRAMQQQI